MSTKVKSISKKACNTIFFVLIMSLAFFTIFKGNSLNQIVQAAMNIKYSFLLYAVLAGVFFVFAEGIMIWYLLNCLGGKSGVLRCVSYSFIGFFYSGITPSATGGQPMQLYYMKKDGNKLSDSSVVLMTVAIVYKFVLSVIGIILLVLWKNNLQMYLGKYMALYYLGLFLNILLVAVLIFVMVKPEKAKWIIVGSEKILVRLHILKFSNERHTKIDEFILGYKSAVKFLINNKIKVLIVIGFTFLQRVSIFVLTYFIYAGFGQHSTDMMTVIMLQASVYIAVDMLPLPGAQGITELMFKSVFQGIFVSGIMPSALLVIRGVNFYFLLIVSLVVVILRIAGDRKMIANIRVDK